MSKDTFTSKTFASWSYRSGTFTGGVTVQATWYVVDYATVWSSGAVRAVAWSVGAMVACAME